MLQLIRAWLDICLLRRAPQDLPASHTLLVVALGCYAAVSVAVTLLSYALPDALLLAAVDLGLLVLFVWVLLSLQHHRSRLNQTLQAMAGSGSILGLAAMPLLVLIGPDKVADEVSMPLVSVWLLLLLWNLFVMAHIVRHALSTSLLIGFGFALLYALISMQVISALFP